MLLQVAYSWFMAGWNAAMASGTVRSDPSLTATSCTIPLHEDISLANGKRGMSSAHKKIHSLAIKTSKLCNENVSIFYFSSFKSYFWSRVISILRFTRYLFTTFFDLARERRSGAFSAQRQKPSLKMFATTYGMHWGFFIELLCVQFIA